MHFNPSLVIIVNLFYICYFPDYASGKDKFPATNGRPYSMRNGRNLSRDSALNNEMTPTSQLADVAEENAVTRELFPPADTHASSAPSTPVMHRKKRAPPKPPRMRSYVESSCSLEPPNIMPTYDYARSISIIERQASNVSAVELSSSFTDFTTTLDAAVSPSARASIAEKPNKMYLREKIFGVVMQTKDFLVQEMNPEGIIEYLRERSVISDNTVQDLYKSNTKHDRCELLLEVIMSKDHDEFCVFCEALRSVGTQSYLADLLEVLDTLIETIADVNSSPGEDKNGRAQGTAISNLGHGSLRRTMRKSKSDHGTRNTHAQLDPPDILQGVTTKSSSDVTYGSGTDSAFYNCDVLQYIDECDDSNSQYDNISTDSGIPCGIISPTKFDICKNKVNKSQSTGNFRSISNQHFFSDNLTNISNGNMSSTITTSIEKLLANQNSRKHHVKPTNLNVADVDVIPSSAHEHGFGDVTALLAKECIDIVSKNCMEYEKSCQTCDITNNNSKEVGQSPVPKRKEDSRFTYDEDDAIYGCANFDIDISYYDTENGNTMTIRELSKKKKTLPQTMYNESKKGCMFGECSSRFVPVLCVNLYNQRLKNDGIRTLALTLENYDCIKELSIVKGHLGKEGIGIIGKALENNSSLIKLDIRLNTLGDNGAKCIAQGLRRNATLKTLNLSSTGLSNTGCNILLGGISKNTCLSELDIGFNDLRDGGCFRIAELLAGNCSLRKLRMRHNNITGFGCKEIFNSLRRNSRLAVLDISSNKIGDESVLGLVEMLLYNRGLKEMNMENCGITSMGCTALARAFKANTTLKFLDISMNDIGDNGSAILADGLKYNKSIETLCLNMCGIGNNGFLVMLDALQFNFTVQVLKLCYNAIGPVRGSLPNLGMPSGGKAEGTIPMSIIYDKLCYVLGNNANLKVLLWGNNLDTEHSP